MGAEEEKSGIKAIKGIFFPEDECWENWWKEKLPFNIMIQYHGISVVPSSIRNFGMISY